MSSLFPLKQRQLLPTDRRQSQGLRAASLEGVLVAAGLALLALAAWGPTVVQSSHYHDFADQRLLLGIPNLMDVLSNLPFAVLGVLGLWRVWRAPPDSVQSAPKHLAALFFFGMAMTALCSGWYHLRPDDGGLAMDRSGMSIAFAGLVGLAASTRVSERAGQWLAFAVLLGSGWSIQIWSSSGNVMPWAVLQGGVIALTLGIAVLQKLPGSLPVPWVAIVLTYAAAKILEQADAQVFHLTHELVSGHTLKHLVASLAAVPVLSALTRASRTLESPAHGATATWKP